MRIEDYALIGDTMTAALVGRNGSIDWLCLPRFDSDAAFAALLGDHENGHWQLHPKGDVTAVRRRYRPGTLVLETEFDTPDGTVRLIDFMPVRQEHADLVRIVEGVRGRVPVHMELVIRFNYGKTVPWVRRMDDGRHVAVAGPDALYLATPVEVRGENFHTVADFTVEAGDRVPFSLAWDRSHHHAALPAEPERLLAETTAYWEDWSAGSTYRGAYADAVQRSLLTLKALTYAPTGGIVAAPTTSLPERIGGVRNWDYRYCWLRDATFTLQALMIAGYTAEAVAWRDWLLRAVAGMPSQIQIMYGAAGERRIPELELDWLAGYEGSRPVRVGNAAVDQFQLDVVGEVMDSLHQSRRAGTAGEAHAWAMQRALTAYVADVWRQPDEGIWEVRGPRRHFTHSKVLAWVAVDRAVKAVEQYGLDGPAAEWRGLRDEIHAEVCREAYDASRGTFVQYYGGRNLDASLLLIPLVGFLPARDERVSGTVAAIEQELCEDGLVARYRETGEDVDGLPPGEGAFLACSFWLADNYTLAGRDEAAHELFDKLLGLGNDVGLFAEEYDVKAGRMVGNFPQAFSHVALVNSADNLSRVHSHAAKRHDEISDVTDPWLSG